MIKNVFHINPFHLNIGTFLIYILLFYFSDVKRNLKKAGKYAIMKKIQGYYG